MGPLITPFTRKVGRQAAEQNNVNRFWNHTPYPTPMASCSVSHRPAYAPPVIRCTELSVNFIHNFQKNLMFLSTRTSSTIQCLVCHPAGQYTPSTRLLPQMTSGELLGKLILQPTSRSSMTQLFLCLVPTCPEGSGAFWTVSAQVLVDVKPVFISGVTSTTHCASVELPRPCRTSLTAARYTSLKVVSLPFTQHLIPWWSGCATAAYAKEKKEWLKLIKLGATVCCSVR